MWHVTICKFNYSTFSFLTMPQSWMEFLIYAQTITIAHCRYSWRKSIEFLASSKCYYVVSIPLCVYWIRLQELFFSIIRLKPWTFNVKFQCHSIDPFNSCTKTKNQRPQIKKSIYPRSVTSKAVRVAHNFFVLIPPKWHQMSSKTCVLVFFLFFCSF